MEIRPAMERTLLNSVFSPNGVSIGRAVVPVQLFRVPSASLRWLQRIALSLVLLLFGVGAAAAADDLKSLSNKLAFYVTKGNIDKVRELLDAGADPRYQLVMKDGKRTGTVLSSRILESGRVRENDIDILMLLLSRGADPNITGDEAWSPLARETESYSLCHVAPKREECIDGGTENFRKVVNILLDFGANPDFVGNEPRRLVVPVVEAARSGNFALVQRMVTGGADINRRDWQQDFALIVSAKSGDLGMVQWLVKMGADVNQQGRYGVSSLMFSRGEVFDFLLDQGADITIRDDKGRTVVDYALDSSSSGKIRSLLRRNMIKDFSMRPFVFAAVRWRDYDLLENVIKLGADTEVLKYVDKGETPLTHAIRNDDLVAVEVLLRCGASPYKREASRSEGHSPIEVAENKNNPAVIALLRKYMKQEIQP